MVDDWEEGSSVLGMEEDTLYGSDFVRMMDILSILAGDGPWHPAGTFISYSPKHIPGMDPAELGLINSLDDGASWDHAGLFPGICVCHAVYALRNDNLFSYPDILRMNDFWVEVKVVHQCLTDLAGNRYDCIGVRGRRSVSLSLFL